MSEGDLQSLRLLVDLVSQLHRRQWVQGLRTHRSGFVPELTVWTEDLVEGKWLGDQVQIEVESVAEQTDTLFPVKSDSLFELGHQKWS